MKKIIALLMVLAMVLAFAACTDSQIAEETDAHSAGATAAATEDGTAAETDAATEPTVMSYADFVAAEIDDTVIVETYIQAKQGWWENEGVGVATFYTQNEEGAYFLYNMPCSQADYDEKLVAGTKIRVTGIKAEWGGEVEIIEATYEILEGEYIATATDLTDKLGTDDLINYQNQFASFKGLTVSSIEFKGGTPGNDIYVNLTKGEIELSFCVESYLTGPSTDLYAAVSALQAGDVIDVEGFVYWYEGVNTHITAITVLDEM